MAAKDEEENIDRHVDGNFDNLNSSKAFGPVFGAQFYKWDGGNRIQRQHPGKPVDVFQVVTVF